MKVRDVVAVIIAIVAAILALLPHEADAADFRNFTNEQLVGADKVLNDGGNKFLRRLNTGAYAALGAYAGYASVSAGNAAIASGAVTGVAASSPVGAAVVGAVIGAAAGYGVGAFIVDNVDRAVLKEEMKHRSSQVKAVVDSGLKKVSYK